MVYWFHTNFDKGENDLRPVMEDEPSIFEFYMIDRTSSGASYPNINSIKEGDKIIFLQNLVAIGRGKIECIERGDFRFREKEYPLRITYVNIKAFRNPVDLRDPEIIEFLQNVPYKNSKYGTFLRKSENTVKILPKRLASTYQRINKEIYDEIIRRSEE